MVFNTFETIITEILENGYAIIDDFINPQLVKELNRDLEIRKSSGQFNKAGIGNLTKVIDEGQRGDFINWIENEPTGPLKEYLLQLEEFRNYLNQTCYLGLATAEIHYASYPAGSFYKKHLDSFQNSNKRRISIITYLNTDWTDADAGELVIYKNDAAVKVLPTGGRMVCFESEKILHEVLPGRKERRSLTGWFLTYQ